MASPYLKVVFRRFRRYSGSTAINVFGLMVAMACCLLIYLYVRNEAAINTSFHEVDRIYRIDSDWRESSMGIYLTTLAPVGETMKQVYPEVIEQVRMYLMTNTVRVEDRGYRVDVMMADTTVFNIFDMPFVRGHPDQAFLHPRSVVITEQLATKLFGTEEALGRTILFETWSRGDQPYTVTGIRQTLPYNSVTYFGAEEGEYDVIMTPYPFGDYFEEDGWTSWQSRYILQYLKLAPGASADRLRDKLEGFIEAYAPEAFHGNLNITLSPLRTLYLDDFDGLGWRVIRILSVIAVLLLVIAAINFMNLSMARSLGRAREVGLLKTLGAHRSQLIRQFVGESIFVCALGALGALAIARVFQQVPFLVTGKEMVLAQPWDGFTLIVLLGLVVTAGIGAGLYPALLLSSFEPVTALRSTARLSTTAGLLGRSLVVMQFTVAIVMVIAVSTISRQLSFIAHMDLGFDRENVLVINSVPRQFDADGIARMEHVKTYLENVPGVVSASLSWRTADEAGDTRAVHALGTDRTNALSLHAAIVDDAFLPTFGLRLKEGRFFSEAFPADTAGVILNETAVQALGWDKHEIEGKELIVWNSARPGVDTPPPLPRPVIGVVEDYHYRPVQQSIGPLAMFSVKSEQMYRVLSLKLNSANLRETVTDVRGAWREVLPGAAFEYIFLDDQIDRAYRAEQQIRRIVGITAAIAVFIACLGMLGLASISVVKRNKEIGIRKVLGAGVMRIMIQFWYDFIKPVLIAVLIALPAAYVILHRWLGRFAYRIDLAPDLFLLGAGLALAVALVAVSYQVVRAATADPVQTLRYE